MGGVGSGQYPAIATNEEIRRRVLDERRAGVDLAAREAERKARAAAWRQERKERLGIPDRHEAPRRVCTVCEQELPIYLFVRDKADPAGRGYRCVDCQRIRNALYRNDPRGRAARAQAKEAGKRRKRLLVEQEKARRGCLRCGERDGACLDYHHRDPADKTAEIGRLIQRDAADATIRAELAKCTVLCANCHRQLHAGRWWLDRTGQPQEYTRDDSKNMAGQRKNPCP